MGASQTLREPKPAGRSLMLIVEHLGWPGRHNAQPCLSLGIRSGPNASLGVSRWAIGPARTARVTLMSLNFGVIEPVEGAPFCGRMVMAVKERM